MTQNTDNKNLPIAPDVAKAMVADRVTAMVDSKDYMSALHENAKTAGIDAGNLSPEQFTQMARPLIINAAQRELQTLDGNSISLASLERVMHNTATHLAADGFTPDAAFTTFNPAALAAAKTATQGMTTTTAPVGVEGNSPIAIASASTARTR